MDCKFQWADKSNILNWLQKICTGILGLQDELKAETAGLIEPNMEMCFLRNQSTYEESDISIKKEL